MEVGNERPDSDESCACFQDPYETLSNDRELGTDDSFAEVSVLVCRGCGQHWLRYFYEHEAFTASGRWYLGAITPRQLSALTAEDAKSLLGRLDWYYYGGSHYGGRRGKASGEITLFP